MGNKPKMKNLKYLLSVLLILQTIFQSVPVIIKAKEKVKLQAVVQNSLLLQGSIFLYVSQWSET